MKRLVVLTGAGISAESGLRTFRDSDGLWENHRVEDVASPDGWRRNPELVLEFYNQRRKQALEARPNAAHLALAQLEGQFNVQIITQNVDDLHERAGSSRVLHLHGELFKVRSTRHEHLVYSLEQISPGGWELNLGDFCERGFQLRPHIVWFGEMVPEIERAAELCAGADLFMVVGTSLQVYPAAGLLEYVSHSVPTFVVDPNLPEVPPRANLHLVAQGAGVGVARVAQELREKYIN